ncbi:MAG: hypothetical protein ABIO55_10130 [Ginsengibacter sp.]
MKFIYYGLTLLLLSTVSCQKERIMDPTSDKFVETEPLVFKPNYIDVNGNIGGFYSAVPAHYSESGKKYPLIVWSHGNGQYGDGKDRLYDLLRAAIPELLDGKLFPPNFKVNGRNFSFIILMPQYRLYPKNSEVYSFIDYAKRNYRIDTTRIYLSGLSEGSRWVCDVAAEKPSMFAAIVPIAGVSLSGDIPAKCKKLVDGNVPIWIFRNKDDHSLSTNKIEAFVSLLNSYHPAIPPKFTEFLPWGLNNHDAWTRATDPYYKENGMNMYEWMLQYHR